MLQTGVVLAGRYEVAEPIAEGGMATVFRGRDRDLDRPVAIKVLADRYSSDPAFVARFDAEAKAAASLNHPSIVTVFDADTDAGRPFIVMELVSGDPLDHLLRTRGPLPPDEAAALGMAVCEALEAAHDRGIVHRDVKPGNILVEPGGRVRVTDFGIARIGEGRDLTQTRTIVGTAQYLSPEQARGLPVDPRSDLYSLGCVLYELLSGSPPFAADSPVAVALRHTTDTPDPLAPSVPPELRRIIRTAMAKKPSNRFRDAGSMRAALGDAMTALETRPTEVMRPSATEVIDSPKTPAKVLARRAERRRRVAALAACVFALLLVPSLLGSAPTSGKRVEGARPNGADATAGVGAVATTTDSAPAPTPDPAARVVAAVEDAVRAGQMDPGDAHDLLANVGLARDELASGRVREARKRVAHLRSWLLEQTEDSRISPSRAAAVLEAMDAFGLSQAHLDAAAAHEKPGPKRGGRRSDDD